MSLYITATQQIIFEHLEEREVENLSDVERRAFLWQLSTNKRLLAYFRGEREDLTEEERKKRLPIMITASFYVYKRALQGLTVL